MVFLYEIMVYCVIYNLTKNMVRKMTFVVTDNCIQCKYTECVTVCPTNSFHEGLNFVVINPENCINCSLCETMCPVGAIFTEAEVLKLDKEFIKLNEELSKVLPVIYCRKEPLKDAKKWENISNKLRFLKLM